MAKWCDTCFCFRDIQRAIVAIGMLSGICSTVQILVSIAVFTGNSDTIDLMMDSKEAITYKLYIALAAADFIMIIFSFLLIYGNERTDEVNARNYLLPWAILVPFYVVYETAINIYYFYNQFNDKYMDPLMAGSEMGYAIVPLVYWILKDILLFVSFVFVVIRIQFLMSEAMGGYVQNIEPCHECSAHSPAPAPQMIAFPAAPSIPRPSLPALPSCTSCSGGCDASRCKKCNLPQPLYGYAGSPTPVDAGRTGWTTSIYNTGR